MRFKLLLGATTIIACLKCYWYISCMLNVLEHNMISTKSIAVNSAMT